MVPKRLSICSTYLLQLTLQGKPWTFSQKLRVVEHRTKKTGTSKSCRNSATLILLLITEFLQLISSLLPSQSPPNAQGGREVGKGDINNRKRNLSHLKEFYLYIITFHHANQSQLSTKIVLPLLSPFNLYLELEA